MHDWAEVRRLHDRDGLSQRTIARRLGMSRNTVARLLMLQEPPRYAREGRASILDPYKGEIAALLDEDAKAPATVILERLRRLGYRGGITILKDHLACVRPSFLAARIFQRTSYLPGEICQIDWWDPGTFVPVGKGRTREVHGLVATLPHSAAHSVVFSFSKTMADYLHCLLGCLVRLGGVPEKIVSDNDPCIVHHRQDRRAVIHDEVAALYGVLGCLGVVLDPGHPERKGQVERTNGYHEGSFMSLRSFEGIGDLQSQSDDWTENIAWGRHHRRVGSKVADALAVERTYLKALPARLPDVTRHLEARVMKDAFVRVAGADYSVPPGLAGRRVAVRLSPNEVVVHLEGAEIARHRRSFVPSDVVLSPAHARALRLARQARSHLDAGDVDLAPIDLSRYDRLLEAARPGPDNGPDPGNGLEGRSGLISSAGVS